MRRGCRACGRPTESRPFNARLHLFLVFVTLGLWFPACAAFYLCGSGLCRRCSPGPSAPPYVVAAAAYLVLALAAALAVLAAAALYPPVRHTLFHR